jgi:alpha-tubulin suppressor-like RCC1 family protein
MSLLRVACGVLPWAGVILAAYACTSSSASSDDTPTGGGDAARESSTTLGDGGSEVEEVTDGASSEAGTTARSVVAVGGAFGCVLAKDRTVSCWGRNDFGQLGRDPGSTPSACGGAPCSAVPTKVPGLENVARLAAGDDFACALDVSGLVRCWGSNTKGQLATTGTASSFTPRQVIANVVDISAAGSHACAITTQGFAHCWGENTCNVFGNNAGAIQAVPRQLPDVPQVSQISVGTDALCATLTQEGRVLCWGADHKGSLGHDVQVVGVQCNGVPADSAPKHVLNESEVPLSGISDVHVGVGVACARQTDGKVFGWGDNDQGALGLGLPDPNAHRRATPIPAFFVKKLDVQGETACAIVADRLMCWGDGRSGKLDSLAPQPTCGGKICRPLPFAIPGMTQVRELASGPGSIFTIKEDRTLWAWGRNNSAEIAVPTNDSANQACTGGVCIPSPRTILNGPPLD